jgi:hypothetical protein
LTHLQRQEETKGPRERPLFIGNAAAEDVAFLLQRGSVYLKSRLLLRHNLHAL